MSYLGDPNIANQCNRDTKSLSRVNRSKKTHHTHPSSLKLTEWEFKMIHIEIKQADILRPEVYSAMLNLIECLKAAPAEVEIKRPAPVERVSTMIAEPDIDPEIERLYQSTIKQKKSLFFLSLVKHAGRIRSEDAQTELQKYFSDVKPKSMGGITGAISRWLDEVKMPRPYETEADPKGDSKIYVWKGLEQPAGAEEPLMSESDWRQFVSQTDLAYQGALKHLRKTGSCEKAWASNKGIDFLGLLQAVAPISHIVDTNESGVTLLGKIGG